jgi:hypothetical protein
VRRVGFHERILQIRGWRRRFSNRPPCPRHRTERIVGCSNAALPLAIPKLFTGHGKSETGSLATIGISGVVLSIYFILSASTFALAAAGISRTLVWTAAIVSGGWLIIGSMVSRGSVEYLNQAFPDKVLSSRTRSIMMTELSIIRSGSPTQFAGELDQLLEKLQQSASDLTEVASADDESIIALVRGDLKTSCRNNDPNLFQQTVATLKERICAREIRLKAARSKVY